MLFACKFFYLILLVRRA